MTSLHLIRALSLVLFLTLSASALTPADVAGHWEGAIEIPGFPLVVKIDLKHDGKEWSGTIDIPQQGAKGVKLEKFEIDDKEKVRFSIAGIPGQPTFDGTIKDGKITGPFTQAGQKFTFKLGRDAVAVKRPNRPQEPKPPLPYKEEEVAYKNGDITFAATLSLPPGKGPHPAVFLITGSGPQNRDEELLDHKPFLILADHLTRAGIAVLRADDRGTGKSTGDFGKATTADFADDALAAVVFLKSRKDIAAERIGLIGHSEGGVVAPIAATKSKDVAFIVLLAGTGVPGDEIVVAQQEAILRAVGAPPDRIKAQVAFNTKLVAILKQDLDLDTLDKKLGELAIEQWEKLDETEKKVIGDVKKLRELLLAGVASPPWMRYFLTHDPRPVLRKVSVPVLAINGELDLQVLVDQNLPEVEKALKESPSKDVTIKRLPGLNHLFQNAKTGSPTEYATIEETFDVKALKLVSEWIVTRFGNK